MAKAKYSKAKDGFYRAKVWDGTYNEDGTKHRINLTSKKSSADLERKVNALALEISAGGHTAPCDYMFQDYARHWLSVKKGVREKNTRGMYDNIVEKHFDFLADTPLSEIRHSHFEQAIANAVDKPRTCQLIYITFRQVMRMAVADSYITKNDYDLICNDINLPKYARTEKRPLSDVEKTALKVCFDNNAFTPRERAFLTLIYYCGLRKGEVLALTRFDLKFEKTGASVSVNKSLIFSGNNPEIKDYPKTDRGIRVVPLPAPAARWLKEYLLSLSGTNLFSSKNSQLISKSSYDKMWKSIIRKMNESVGGTAAFPLIDDLTAHIFRHNYCSQLCYKVPAVSIKKIAQLMGDTIAVIMKVYDHIIEEKENVTEAVSDALSM